MRKLWFLMAVVSCHSPIFVEDEIMADVEEMVEADIEEMVKVRSDWDIFIEALIQIESGGDSLAVGSKDDVGVLQITPILLIDANRILGYEKYKLNDRYSKIKSIEIFNIIQNYYNEDLDFHFALKVWNSKAPLSYHNKVMEKFNRLKTK